MNIHILLCERLKLGENIYDGYIQDFLKILTVILNIQGRPPGLKCGRRTGGERSELEGDDT